MTELALRPIDRVGEISRDRFAAAYLEPQRPVILTELAASWPALEKWTPQYFKSAHGNKSVKVYNAGFAAPGQSYMCNASTLPLGDYLDAIYANSTDLRMFLYNLSKEIPELLRDLDPPTFVSGIGKSFVFMFFGCRGAVTQMHFDIDLGHVFHTQIRGSKTITLYPYAEGTNLHRHPFTCRSYVDVHAPDFSKFPSLARARGYRDVLRRGETLFMPGGYWHHMVYEEPGYALSLRCPHQSMSARARGYANLFVLSPIDRVMNKIAPSSWFRWKEKRARASAELGVLGI